MATQKELMEQAKTEHGVGGSTDYLQFDKSGEYRIRQLTAAYPMASHFFGPGVKAKVCYGADKGCPYHGDGAPIDEKTGEEKKASVKFVCYVLDRRDGKIKLAELPFAVIKVVTDLQEDPDYAFEDFPCPYDLKITFNKETKAPNDKYKTLPAPKIEPITAEEASALAEKLKTSHPEQYVERRKQKQRDDDGNSKSLEAVAEAQYAGDDQQPPDDYPEYPGDPTI